MVSKISTIPLGSVLSYSAGSKHSDPYAFRVIKPASPSFEFIIPSLPALGEIFTSSASPIIINSYPATISLPAIGYLVDTYLSQSIAKRALLLARRENRSAIILGQPLFIADLLLSYSATELLPASLLVVAGGYYFPSSLQVALEHHLQDLGVRLIVLHAYGIAEVDAACLLGMYRAEDGAIQYFPRGNDIRASVVTGELLLSKYMADGTVVIEMFPTGDSAETLSNGALTITNPSRLSDKTREYMEEWHLKEWQRLTGYMYESPQGVILQLRRGFTPTSDRELPFYRFCELSDMSWLSKPQWDMTWELGSNNLC